MVVPCYSSLTLYQSGAPLLNYFRYYFDDSQMPVPVVARSKAWVCGRSPAGIVGSNPAGGMDVCLLRVLCVVRTLCVGLIILPEESYRLWGVVVCDLETS